MSSFKLSFMVLTFAILISHAFVGPLLHFEHVFKDIGQGNLSKPINLRRGDELVETKNEINEMMAHLKKNYCR